MIRAGASTFSLAATAMHAAERSLSAGTALGSS
jgi:hypothetical protein